jgi:hypothetical protein
MVVTHSEPAEVRVEFEGKWFRIRLGLHVFEVSSMGSTDANGLPQFNVKAAPVMMVTREEDDA